LFPIGADGVETQGSFRLAETSYLIYALLIVVKRRLVNSMLFGIEPSIKIEDLLAILVQEIMQINFVSQ